MTVDPDAIRPRHTKTQYGDPEIYPEYWYCRECNMDLSVDPRPWPCDAIQLLDAVAAETDRCQEISDRYALQERWDFKIGSQIAYYAARIAAEIRGDTA